MPNPRQSSRESRPVHSPFAGKPSTLAWTLEKMAPCKVQRIIFGYCRSRPEMMEVWFHGSRFRGDHRPDSDLDLYFEFDSKLIPEGWTVVKDLDREVERLRKALQPLFDMEVHPTFAHYEMLSGGLRAAARTGALVYCRPDWDPNSETEQ